MHAVPSVSPKRFRDGYTFDEYLRYLASPVNLAREGYEGGPRLSPTQQRADLSREVADWYASFALTEPQVQSIRLLAAQRGGPARIVVISEEWSSDCRRDVPVFQRIAEAANLDLRVFPRDGVRYSGTPEPTDSPNADLMSQFVNRKAGGPYQSIPVAAFFAADGTYLYHYTEYPALYQKDLIQTRLRRPRPGETAEAATQRYAREWAALRQSPFFSVWTSACADEIIASLHRRLLPE